MSKQEYPEKAIELLDKYFPKGEKFSRRGEAMVILSMAFVEGRELETKILLKKIKEKIKCKNQYKTYTR